MTFISYAQNLEDVMLWRALKKIENGFYIDVGANDPVQDSVTKAFYDHGWRGINIEPAQQYYQRLCQERDEDINLPILAGDSAGELPYFEIPNTGLSTLDREIADIHKKNGCEIIGWDLPVKTLSEICSKYAKRDIHFLKIDVEGAEKQVLLGMDFQRYRPWIVLVEATLPMSQTENYASWEPILLDANYFFVYADGLNRFYVSAEHRELVPAFKYPPNVFDGFIHYVLQRVEIEAAEANAKAVQAEDKAAEAWQNYNMITNSYSWKMTYPLRIIKKEMKWFVRGSIAWLMLTPGSHSRRVFKKQIISLKQQIKDSPRLKAILLRALSYYPSLEVRLRNIRKINEFTYYTQGVDKLSPRAEKIYGDLKDAMGRDKKL